MIDAKNVKDFIAKVKAAPGKYSYASTGNGTGTHLAFAAFNAQAGLDMVHVPYKGGPDATNSRAEGRDLLHLRARCRRCCSTAKAGKVRLLGVTTTKRVGAMPDLPTIAEAGLPGYESYTWFGIFGPKGLDPAIAAKMNAALKTALEDPEIKKKLVELGNTPRYETLEQFKATVKRDRAKWAEVGEGRRREGRLMADHRNIARGGKSIYGAPLGILMLEARFPRIPGDMGNGTTWPFPVLFRVVRGASPEKVVLNGATGLLQDFVAAATDLVDLGAEAITTNCGFLSIFQREIAAAVGVPVATSSLMQVPWVQATLPPGKRVGIVSVSAKSLTPAHLEGAGVPLDAPIAGTENGREFFRVLIKGEKQDLDVDLARQDVVEAGKGLVARHPDIGAIVLECTNMPPYAAALQEAIGLPVYDIYSMITWFHAGLRPKSSHSLGARALRGAHVVGERRCATEWRAPERHNAHPRRSSRHPSRRS